ncbi:MAG: glycosyltransferase family 39 protein [Leptospiraceae bacterium]|nr:glycosyltransferase family 39 protein [Leptospiraceae bacterium]MDW7976707.1 glycosyltransferase family 39 protein [Leptospiraceae bacterium]
MKIINQKYIFLLALVFVFILKDINEPLWEQDEAAYAGFGLHFLIHPDHQFIPNFPLSEPHRKPPLLFFFIENSYRLWGVNEFAVRFINLVLSLFFLISLPIALRIYFRKREIDFFVLGILVFFSFLIINTYVRIALTDFLLLFFQFLMIFVNYAWYQKDGAQKISLGLILIFILIIGTLIKGPVILVNFLLINIFYIFLLFIAKKKFDVLKNIYKIIIIFIFSILPISFWFLYLYQSNQREFVIWFLDWYIFKRVGGSVFGQTGPPGYYFLSILIASFPWSLETFKVLKSSFFYILKKIKFFTKNKKVNLSNKILYEISAFFSLYFVYEFLPSKLPSYILAFYVVLWIWILRFLVKNPISFPSLLVRVMLAVVAIQTFLFFTSDMRKTSKVLGSFLQRHCEDKNVFISNQIRLPGIVWYYVKDDSLNKIKEKYQKIHVLQDYIKRAPQLTTQNNCFLLLKSEFEIFKNIIHKDKQILHKEGWIFDKFKKEEFVIVY